MPWYGWLIVGIGGTAAAAFGALLWFFKDGIWNP